MLRRAHALQCCRLHGWRGAPARQRLAPTAHTQPASRACAVAPIYHHLFHNLSVCLRQHPLTQMLLLVSLAMSSTSHQLDSCGSSRPAGRSTFHHKAPSEASPPFSLLVFFCGAVHSANLHVH